MEKRESEKIWRRMTIRCALFLALGCFFVLGMPYVLRFFLPFLLAFWVAMGLNPLVCQLEVAMGWKRTVIVLFLLFLMAGVILSFSWLVIPVLLEEITTLGRDWEPLLEEGLEIFMGLAEELRVFLKADTMLGDSVELAVEKLKEGVSALVSRFFLAFGDWVMKLPGYLIGFFVFLMASYFMTIDYPFYQGKIRQYTTRQWRWWAGEIKETAVQAFGGYLKAQFILTLGVGVIMLVGFLWMELPFALVLALFIAFLDFIPMIGAGAVLLPWAMVAFFTGNQEMCWQLGVIWLLTAGFRRILEPKVLGQQTGLSPLLSLLSIYVGLQVGGLWGMVLAPVVFLMVLHFLGMGIFRGTWDDGKACIQELRYFFEENRENL